MVIALFVVVAVAVAAQDRPTQSDAVSIALSATENSLVRRGASGVAITRLVLGFIIIMVGAFAGPAGLGLSSTVISALIGAGSATMAGALTGCLKDCNNITHTATHLATIGKVVFKQASVPWELDATGQYTTNYKDNGVHYSWSVHNETLQTVAIARMNPDGPLDRRQSGLRPTAKMIYGVYHPECRLDWEKSKTSIADQVSIIMNEHNAKVVCLGVTYRNCVAFSAKLVLGLEDFVAGYPNHFDCSTNPRDYQHHDRVIL
jgi:hypothetical protein